MYLGTRMCRCEALRKWELSYSFSRIEVRSYWMNIRKSKAWFRAESPKLVDPLVHPGIMSR